MAGIYIHIPFCKQACHYCNFHFSTSLQQLPTLCDALVEEIQQRKNEFPACISSIYIGGGTPSLLPNDQLLKIVSALQKIAPWEKKIEFTLEANPDDINPDRIEFWKRVGINRLSIGIQSFFEEDLRYMNRAHSAQQAKQCIQWAQAGGINNISVDLIFGYPLLTSEKLQFNLDVISELNIPHISCYAMTVEPKTVLAHQIKKKLTPPIQNEHSANQFMHVMHFLQAKGYEHYEISNYATSGHRAIHNSNYWKGIPYIGLGPSAHSYNLHSRQWNIANNALYIKKIMGHEQAFETEVLSRNNMINETIMIRLRMMEGLDINSIYPLLNEIEWTQCKHEIEKQIKAGYLFRDASILRLTELGKMYADWVAASLFIV